MSTGASLPATQINQTLSGRWRLDRRRSRVEFRTRAAWGLVAVRGHFEVFEGRLDLAADPAIELAIDTESLQTGNGKRDRHLRSGDFFDSENHPRMRFVSECVEPDGQSDTLLVHGRLCARGRSIPLAIPARIHADGDTLEIDASVTAPHRELGMTWNWLGAIRPHSTLHVRARLTPDA